MSESNDLNHSILNLSAQEKPAFSYLFGLADTDSLNVVTGERAVSFFEKTSVPAPVLGEIWQIADTENRGLLTKAGFCMVLRLIGWYQNGQTQPSTELAFKQAPLPKFDGINLPPAAQQQQQPASPAQGNLQPQLTGQSAGGPIRVPPLDPGKVQQYSGLFGRSGAQNGMLDGGTAKNIFEKAGLSNDVLGKIWMLSDREQRGALDETEFIVAMHLLTSMKTRTMAALPNTLPPGLYEAAARRGQRPPSRQMSTQGGIPRQFTGGSSGVPARTQSPLARPLSSSQNPAVQSTQQTGGQSWLVTQQEKAQYDRFFTTVDTAGRGVLTGEQAVQFFSDSRLPEDTLASIWDLADINSEGQLNKDEFAVAMYLIRQQRAPNPPPVPAFLPNALVPPSMRGQQQGQQQGQQAPQQAQPSPFESMNQTPSAPKSASDDLFGLDSSPTQNQFPTSQAALQPQGTGASATRDPFGGSQGSVPASPARFQQQASSSTFKPFIPTSAFGASLASQNTGGSATSSQPQQTSRAPIPSNMDDLLGDNDAHAAESSKLSNETSELANMSNQIGNLRTQMESTQSQKVRTAGDLSATNKQKTDLEQRLQQFRAQYEAEVRTVKEMEQQLATSRDSTKKLSQDAAMLEGTYQDLQTQHNTVAQQLRADQEENSNLKQKISQINAEVTRLRPEIEKMKMDARQQKGLVSINKKQLTTNESERDRLQSERGDLEREASEMARSAAASPEPMITSQASNVASPSAASALSSTNPFFRKASQEGTSSPPATSSGPTPSAFDALFGPSAAFAPTGQAGSRSGTPPATSFIGRSMPSTSTAAIAGAVGAGAAALGLGGMAMTDSMSSAGENTPAATPPVSDGTRQTPLETPVSTEPPPPPESRQFTPSSLPIGGGVVGQGGTPESDAGSSTKVVPPASRAGGVETPRELAPSPPPLSGGTGSLPRASPVDQPESQREVVPGAFPDDEAQPSTVAQEIVPSGGPSTQTATPAPQVKPNDDFESAFASFGTEEKDKDADTTDDPFAPSSSQAGPTQTRGFNSEFPPIETLEGDDESDSDDSDNGFDDNFTSSSPRQNGAPASSTEPHIARVASGDDMAAVRPTMTSIESTASDLPTFEQAKSPPTYEQSDNPAFGGSGDRTASNQFPPEFGDLLPSREDPTSPPPPDAQHPSSLYDNTPLATPSEGLAASQPSFATRESMVTPSTDEFADAQSRPTSNFFGSMNQNTAASSTEAPRNAFDEFDDFGDLSEAKEADKSGSDLDFFGRQSQDDFNSTFDSPAVSSTPTPMRSVQQSQESNGFADFQPNVSTGNDALSSGSGDGSIQQTPQNVQHDWDAIFSGLDDNSKDIDTSFNNTSDPWSTAEATTNGGSTAAATSSITASAATAGMSPLGRAVTPGTEHDDPILKRLTGMGYARADALGALEKFDYDINKAVDHLTSS